MKTTKKLAALLLALAIGIGMALPAFAEGEPRPIITKQPPKLVAMKTGQTATLEVQAKLPEGATGKLKCQWYESYDPDADFTSVEGATEPTLKLSFSADDLWNSPRQYGLRKYYYAEVFYQTQPEVAPGSECGGAIITWSIRSNTVKVECFSSFSDTFRLVMIALEQRGLGKYYTYPISRALLYVWTFPAAVFSELAARFMSIYTKLKK